MNEPATLEAIEGSDASRITLTAEAAERVGHPGRSRRRAGRGTVIPYAAVFYTATGDTWAYTNPEPLDVRARADRRRPHPRRSALLSDGPPRAWRS